MSTGKAFRAALTEKYSKLAAEAKTHSNPENYIHSKYFDKSSEYYETNLTDTERRIAYNYEMQMCRTGKINGVNYQDSLFRGLEVDGDSVDSDKIQFERALVNSQISNILKQAGVDLSLIHISVFVLCFLVEIAVVKFTILHPAFKLFFSGGFQYFSQSTVSYTHLDVYKRQSLFFLDTGKCRW